MLNFFLSTLSMWNITAYQNLEILYLQVFFIIFVFVKKEKKV